MAKYIFFALLLKILNCTTLVSNVDGRAKCREPAGVEGDVVEEGCFKMTCTAIFFKMGIWVKIPAE